MIYAPQCQEPHTVFLPVGPGSGFAQRLPLAYGYINKIPHLRFSSVVMNPFLTAFLRGRTWASGRDSRRLTPAGTYRTGKHPLFQRSPALMIMTTEKRMLLRMKKITPLAGRFPSLK